MPNWVTSIISSDYLVSDDGQVYNLLSGKMLSTRGLAKGYPKVGVRVPGKRYTLTVHKLMKESFDGKTPIGMECAHMDGNPLNCVLDNITFCSRKENHAHKKLHGTYQCSENNPAAKLTNKQVLDIRSRLASGIGRQQLADEYGVTYHAIRLIHIGKKWTYLNV